MKKVSRKAKTKKVSRKQIKKSESMYPAYVLGIVLVAVLLSESALFMSATPADWHAGFSVLDMSSGVASMVSDVKVAMEPTNFTFHAVNDFYNQAAIASTQYFDLSGSNNSNTDPLMAVLGINNFYKAASQQMADVLDLSNYVTNYKDSFQPIVAGASISR